MKIREIPIAIRAHTEIMQNKKLRKPFKHSDDLRKPYGKRIMVLDTETTTDIYMNLLFGQAMIIEGINQVHIDGMVKEHYLVYGHDISEEDMTILRQYAKDKEAIFISKQEFIKEVFWPEIWELGTLCVGFNLPFDLSRLAISVRTFQKGKYKDMFELKLSDSKYKPTILIKPIDSKKAFISLRFPTRPKTSSKRIPFQQGRFLDLRTLVFALTNESHSLASACNLYRVKHGKGFTEEHGIITPEYVEYNRRDVEATLELYCKAKEEFDRHPLSLEAGKAYSPATIGKAYYQAMGIKPFHEKQPDFPKEIIGYAMAAYYGGRSECHYRNTPVKTFHTDITSMYPSVFTLQNLWSWVIAGELEVREATEEIKDLLDNINIDVLFNKETWLNIPGLVQVLPDHDLLPVRAEYGKKNGYQIGLNYLSSNDYMWYTLADVISCKMLTGKTPRIIRAIRIIPGEPQEGLNSIKIRGQIPIDPAKDNFFKKVIELRKEVKKKVNQKGDENDAMQLFLKILANSTSYGVYIEMNRTEYEQDQEIGIYGLDNFLCSNKYVDINGKYYNPLIAVMITGAARLILAMMEKSILDLGGNFAFCDTDSMAIIDLKHDRPDVIGVQVVNKFKSLYPYDDDSKQKGASLLEAEDYNWGRIDWEKDTDKININKDQYYPLYCYMVSAKRYVLYNLIPDNNGIYNIVIRKKSDHGLGHLMSPVKGSHKNDWVNEVWRWILSHEHSLPYQEPEWFYYPAFAQLSISKPSIYNIMNRNQNIDYSDQVKPSNFLLVAYSIDDKIFGNHLISKYYCRLYRAVGKDLCRNKSNCKYASTCYSNLHMIPITSYDDPANWEDFKWLEKNTKEPLQIKLSQSRSKNAMMADYEQQLEQALSFLTDLEKQSIMESLNKHAGENKPYYDNENILIIKSYYDFIKEYSFHPELKYDDSSGNPCGQKTKGLLNKTHIKASEIKHIGKETNTLQDKEEEAVIPDEANWDDTILSYSQDNLSNSKIDYEQWQELIQVLKDKAKPRKIWAEIFDISLDYFKQLLAGKRQPSSKLYEIILAQCKKEGLKIPEGRKPSPHFFETGKTNIYPLGELALKYGISVEEIKIAFEESIFVLHGSEYLSIDFDHVKKYLSEYRKNKQQKRKHEEMQAIQQPEVYGKCLSGSNNEAMFFGIEEITHFQVAHEVGRSYKTLHVRLKGGNIFQVLQKDNPLIFKYGLLPKPSKIPYEQDKKKVVKKNGYAFEYSKWEPYDNVPRLNEKQILSLYGISRKMLDQAIEENSLPDNSISIVNDKIMVNPLDACRLYLKSVDN